MQKLCDIAGKFDDGAKEEEAKITYLPTNAGSPS